MEIIKVVDYKNWYFEYCRKYDFLKIRAMVKGIAQEGVVIRKQISSSVKDKRAAFWNKKRTLGHYARNIYLAYALIRNVPYKICENKCDELSKPQAKQIFEILESFAKNSFAKEYNVETIQNWLDAENIQEKAIAS